jgi:hypothetical protein
VAEVGKIKTQRCKYRLSSSRHNIRTGIGLKDPALKEKMAENNHKMEQFIDSA